MKYEIDIKGLPEGYKALEVRFDPSLYNKYPGDDGYTYFEAKVKVKKNPAAQDSAGRNKRISRA